jgi:putative ATP-dependent DNA ligase
MDREACVSRLDATVETPTELFEHIRERSFEGRPYHALPDARHGVERGTVLLDRDGSAAIVRGYPSVPRVLVLDAGVRSVFDDDDAPVAVEEKLNGFNVRIVRVAGWGEADDDGAGAGAGPPDGEVAAAADGDLLAFTRGGYVCPYTTARARTRLDTDAFFDEYPDAMLCAELVGPETPYTSHDYAEVDSHAFRVFGIRDRETGEPVPVADRRERCERYGFDQPHLFGTGDPAAVVAVAREAIDELDARGREGVVLKSADGSRLVKYTTEAQHHAELAYAFSVPFDRGADFVFSRVVREAFQAAERDEADERLRERAHDLGESILLPFVETIREVADGEPVGERQTVRGAPAEVDALLDHLRGVGLTVEVLDDRREDGQRVVEFVKRSAATTDRIEHYLEGGTLDE